MDGSAISLVLQNPLARDHFLNDFLLWLPPIFLMSLTWIILIIEILYLPAYFFPKLRPFFWLTMLLIQFGFLVFLNFADLTIPMLLIHALCFDRRWLPVKNLKEKTLLFYDGTCAFCNKVVMFGLSENTERNIQFAPLYAETYTKINPPKIKDDSIIFMVDNGKKKEFFYKSDAVIELLLSLGGFWLFL